MVFTQDSLRLQSVGDISQLKYVQVYIWIVFDAIQRIQEGRKIRESSLPASWQSRVRAVAVLCILCTLPPTLSASWGAPGVN